MSCPKGKYPKQRNEGCKYSGTMNCGKKPCTRELLFAKPSITKRR